MNLAPLSFLYFLLLLSITDSDDTTLEPTCSVPQGSNHVNSCSNCEFIAGDPGECNYQCQCQDSNQVTSETPTVVDINKCPTGDALENCDGVLTCASYHCKDDQSYSCTVPPEGEYAGTCNDCTVSQDGIHCNLSCSCQNKNGIYTIASALDINTCPQKLPENCNGKLLCESTHCVETPSECEIPFGDYSGSCVDCEVSTGENNDQCNLSCNCQDSNGHIGDDKTTLDLFTCPELLPENCGGTLRCEAHKCSPVCEIPTGDYSTNCKDCVAIQDGKKCNLTCNCKNANQEFSGETKLDINLCPDRIPENCDGKLFCDVHNCNSECLVPEGSYNGNGGCSGCTAKGQDGNKCMLTCV